MAAIRRALLLCLALLTVPAAAHADGRVLMVGDSLGVGVQPYLPGLLDGHDVSFRVRSGEGSPWALPQVRAGLLQTRPQTLVMSMGTNDGPDPARFRSRIRRVLRAAPRPRCVIWLNIVRPARKGAYRPMNRVLRREDRRYRRLKVLDWARAVRTGKVSLPDTVHPDAAGYRYRARMIAAAVRSGC